MSAYWTPQLYFQWANGSFSPVQQVGGGLIYYLQRFNRADTTKVMAFPDGLRILTGNPFLRSYNASSPMAKAIGWNCLGSPSPTRNPWLPPVDCPNGLRAEIMFPSCWDGQNVDVSGYKENQDETFSLTCAELNRVPTTFRTWRTRSVASLDRAHRRTLSGSSLSFMRLCGLCMTTTRCDLAA